MAYDYLIVGAGSAGCVLASRLSAHAHNRVCLLEAGPDDDSMLVRMPAGIIALMRSKRRNWRYWSTPQAALDGRRLYIPRGKTMGGSSSVNAMIYTRGVPHDYDRWAELGNPGWSWQDVLPVFKRCENNARGADALHGHGGPLNVADPRYTHAASRAFVEAAMQAGFPFRNDFNGPEQQGVGPYQLTQTGGERSSVARGYLPAEVRRRSNLHIVTGALATRILLDGKRARGAEYRARGRLHSVEAGTVIVSGGSINSPQLLLLSGIGPRDALTPHGIAQQHDLPGVGHNLHDHPDALVVLRSPRHDTLSLGPGSLPRALRGLWQYLRERQGMFTSNVAETGGFLRSQPDAPLPDLQLHLSAALLDQHGLNWRFSLGWGISAHVAVLRPRSRGRLTLASADPTAAPLIDPHLLEDPRDMQCLLRGLKIVRAITREPALAPWRGEEIFPGKDRLSDQALRAYLRAKTETIYHPVGTCRMGNDAMAVVDAGLRVHGLDGLYVVDASIMPEIIGGNTNAPTVMIAEKAVDGMPGAAAPSS